MKKKFLALVLVAVLTCSLFACGEDSTVKKTDFVGLTMSDATYVYDGLEKTLVLAEVPDGATVNYSNNKMTNVGENTVEAVVTKDGYNSLTLNAKLKITKAPLTCSAENATMVVESPALPSFTATYTGFVNNETVTNLGGALTFACSATSASPIGVYRITPSGLTATNYEIAYVAGNLTVKGVDATSVSITNTITVIDGNTLKLTSEVLPAKASQKVAYTLKADVAGVSLAGDTITLGAGSVTGAKFTVIATSVGTTIKCEKEFEIGYRGEYLPILNEADLRNALFTSYALNYELKNDITLSNEPWGKVTYNGNFDGKGFSILNFNGVDTVADDSHYGFFTIVGANASVKNLRVKGSATTVNVWSGGFVGTNNGTIENCISEINIKSAGANCGSFVGANEGTISKCLSLGKVNINNSTTDFGGGFTWGGTKGKYYDCFFSASHTGASKFGNWDTKVGLSDTELLTKSTFAGKLDETFWNLSNFAVPELKSVGKTPTVVTPTISITNTATEIFAGENLTLTSEITPNSDVGYKLAVAVAGISVSENVVTVGANVANNVKFTVVVYSIIDNAVTASKEFTVKVVESGKETVAYAKKQTYELAEPKNNFEFTFPETGKITNMGGTEIPSTYASGKFTILSANVPAMVKGIITTLKVETDTKIYKVTVLPITKLLKTKEDLQSMDSNLDGYYVLGNDIDCQGMTFKQIGNAGVDVDTETNVVTSHTTTDGIMERAFTGTFEGNGYSILNLTETKDAEQNIGWEPVNFGFGLFGMIGATGVAQNFTLENVSITSGNQSGFIAGVNLGAIKNVKVLSGIADAKYKVHDFVYLNAGSIENCINLVSTGVKNFVEKNTGSIINSYSVQTKFSEVDSVFPATGTITASGFKTLEELGVVALYSGYDPAIWTILAGSTPVLIKGSII